MKLDRRTLLIGGGAGVGLVVAFAAWPRHLSSELAVGRNEQAFGNFIKIAREGRVTVAVPQAETGQGIWSALPQIVADELGAAWETVAVEPAPLVDFYANPLAVQAGWLDGLGWLRRHEVAGDDRARMTAASTSVRAFEGPLREATSTATGRTPRSRSGCGSSRRAATSSSKRASRRSAISSRSRATGE